MRNEKKSIVFAIDVNFWGAYKYGELGLGSQVNYFSFIKASA